MKTMAQTIEQRQVEVAQTQLRDVIEAAGEANQGFRWYRMTNRELNMCSARILGPVRTLRITLNRAHR